MSDEDRPRYNQFDAEQRSRGTAESVASNRNPDRVHHTETSAKIYTPEETEYLAAVQRFQERTGRKFPTFVELFGVAKVVIESRKSNLDPDSR